MDSSQGLMNLVVEELKKILFPHIMEIVIKKPKFCVLLSLKYAAIEGTGTCALEF